MKRFFERRAVGRAFLALLITGMTVSAVYTAKSAWGKDDAPKIDRVLRPPLGQENQILYSIPQGGREKATVGTAVSKLPVTCTTFHRRASTYYSCEGIYFKPHFRGREVVYVVVEKP